MKIAIASLALFLLAQPASAYVLVTTDGGTIEVVGAPRSDGGRLLVVFDGGRRSSIDASLIDAKATKRANAGGSLYGWRELRWWRDVDGRPAAAEPAPLRLGLHHPGGLAKSRYVQADLEPATDETLPPAPGVAPSHPAELERARAELQREYARIGKMLEALDARAASLAPLGAPTGGTTTQAPAPVLIDGTPPAPPAGRSDLPLTPPLLVPLPQ